jgi:hypothetical protein
LVTVRWHFDKELLCSSWVEVLVPLWESDNYSN